MIASEHLFKLIKSLNKSEKRYFQMFASTHREASSYTLLFDLIKDQEEYDEKKIKQKLPAKLRSQFPVTKHLLYKLILRSMNQYHSERSVDLLIRELLFAIDFQFEKTLYSECRKSLLKAKELAGKYEKFEFILDILRWERKLMTVSSNNMNTMEEAERIFNEEQEAINKLNNASRYALLHKQLSITSATYAHLRSEKEKQKLQLIMKDTLLKKPEMALSFDAKTYFFQIHSYYSRFIEETEKSYTYRENLMKLWEEHPHFIKEYPAVFIPIVQNLLNVQLDKKMYDVFNVTSEKLKVIKPRSDSDRMLLFLAYYPVKLTYHANTMKPDEIGIVTDAEREFEEFEDKLRKDHVITFYYLFSLCHFLNGNFRSSLKWINTILNSTKLDVRPDIGSAVLLMNLIVHYELKNFDLMEYIIKSTYRSLLKMERLYEFEKIILKFLRELPVKNTPAEMNIVFKKLKNQLEVLENNPYENKAFKYFDFISWLESKIEGKPFAEVVRSKEKE